MDLASEAAEHLSRAEGFTDSIVRAITEDGAFRVITAHTTQTVRGALAAQQGKGETAQHFGDLLTAAVLFRQTMAPDLRVQGILRGRAGRGTLVADSHPSGLTRGLIQLPEGLAGIEVGEGSLLRMLRTLPGGKINQGVVEVAESGSVTAALMSYMHVSEQVDTMLAVGTVLDGDEVVVAGGYLVQLLPEVGRGPLMVMTERLEDFRSVTPYLRDPAFTPDWLLDQLLYRMPFTRLEENRVGFGCWCSEMRVISALATLPRGDIEHLMEGGELLDISCDYCGKQYQVAPAQLRGLLDPS
jgi:molecular chaperone Hsp33